jgi:hypothetical protein
MMFLNAEMKMTIMHSPVLYFLIELIPVSLVIWAVHILFQEGHLLEEVGARITKDFGEKWSKPLINCPICMSSFWGTILFTGWYVKQWDDFLALPTFIMCLCGLQVLLTRLTTKERIIVDE